MKRKSTNNVAPYGHVHHGARPPQIGTKVAWIDGKFYPVRVFAYPAQDINDYPQEVRAPHVVNGRVMKLPNCQ